MAQLARTLQLVRSNQQNLGDSPRVTIHSGKMNLYGDARPKYKFYKLPLDLALCIANCLNIHWLFILVSVVVMRMVEVLRW